MSKAKRGIYAAAVSPFREDGSLDVPKLIAYCRHLVTDGGCDGVAPTGTTGEGNSISMRDRMALPGAFAEAGFDPSCTVVDLDRSRGGSVGGKSSSSSHRGEVPLRRDESGGRGPQKKGDGSRAEKLHREKEQVGAFATERYRT